VPRTYDAEFRRRVVELVRVVAAELGLTEATVYRWKAQDLIDRGLKPGTSTSLMMLSLSRVSYHSPSVAQRHPIVVRIVAKSM
jgi:transposase